MDQDGLLNLLQGAGLSPKAASIYLSLIRKNKMTLTDIAKASGTKRATCYEHIDVLLSKDFIVRVPIGKRMFYSAVSPKKILAGFKKQVEELEKSIPTLLSIHEKALQKPRVSFYEGKKEIRRIYDDMLTTVGDVQSIFPPAAFFENFSENDYSEFDKMLTAHAIQSKDLFIADKFYKKVREVREANGPENKSDKKLPEWFRSNVDVLIYSEKVALISLHDLSAIVIENKDIADLFRNIHQALWRMS